jgi:hypothetical protein
MGKPVIPIRSSTQQFIEIVDIDHNVVMFVDGSCVMVIASAAVNFGLLSQNEQAAIIYAYAGLLNSLSFPVEILIRTQHKDITQYLELLRIQEEKQKKSLLKESISNYRKFIASTVKERNVLDKKFYFVVPFSSIELGLNATTFVGTAKKTLPYPKEYIFERAITILNPKKDHILRLLARLGLKATPLTTEQLMKLFYGIYNPGSIIPHDFEGIETNKTLTK